MLGAITGERLEFRVQPDVYKQIGPAASHGFCANDADEALKTVASAFIEKWNAAKKTRSMVEEWKHRKAAGIYHDLKPSAIDRFIAAEKRLKKEQSHSDWLEQLQKQMSEELARLRKRGVKGKIPLCMYPLGAKRPRELRRSTAVHERFHADVARAAVKEGITGDYDGACLTLDRAMDIDSTAMLPVLHATAAMYLANDRSHALEEILARVEESRVACKRSEKDCKLVRKKISKELSSTTVADRGFDDFAQSIRENHGSPLNFARKLLRVCKVPR